MSCCCFSATWSPSTSLPQLTAPAKFITPSSTKETLTLLSTSSSLINLVLISGCGWRSAISSLHEQRTGCLSCFPGWLRSILKCFSCCCKGEDRVTKETLCALLTRLSTTYGVVVLAMALTALAGRLEELCKEGLVCLESTLHAECVRCYCNLVLAEAELKLERSEVDGNHRDMPDFLTDPGGNPFGIVLLVQKICSTFSSRISSCS